MKEKILLDKDQENVVSSIHLQNLFPCGFAEHFEYFKSGFNDCMLKNNWSFFSVSA